MSSPSLSRQFSAMSKRVASFLFSLRNKNNTTHPLSLPLLLNALGLLCIELSRRSLYVSIMISCNKIYLIQDRLLFAQMLSQLKNFQCAQWHCLVIIIVKYKFNSSAIARAYQTGIKQRRSTHIFLRHIYPSFGRSSIFQPIWWTEKRDFRWDACEQWKCVDGG